MQSNLTFINRGGINHLMVESKGYTFDIHTIEVQNRVNLTSTTTAKLYYILIDQDVIVEINIYDTYLLGFIIIITGLTILILYIRYTNSITQANTLKHDLTFLQGKSVSMLQMTKSITDNAYHELFSHIACIEYATCIFTAKSDKEKIMLDTVKQAVYSIKDYLALMRKVKEVKNTNGTQSLYNIFVNTANIIKTAHDSGISRVINGSAFHKYSVGMPLNNSLFTNIIVNHLKNSLEAHATEIEIKFISLEGDKLTFDIIDNGNGIPEDFLPYLFKENMSTKSKSPEDLRGNGIFTNKVMLNNYDNSGDLQLINTSKSGTTFRITLRIKNAKMQVNNSTSIV